jgi:cellulose synthase operon protein C
MMRRNVLLAVALVAALPLLAGCGALLGQRYEDFTAYYNTFYNARRDFEREERAILRADEPVDRTRFLSIFPRPPATAAGGGRGSGGLDNAIRKAADVLRDHPGSRWVDDALLLIGKAYFYQGNYDAAAQKFREVLSLERTGLADEAYLWLGRAHMEARDYGSASGALREGLAREGVRERWASRMRLAMGEVFVRQGYYDEAAESLRTGINGMDDGELAARALFLLGQVHDSRGAHGDAASAYREALARRPSPEVEFAAALQQVLALSQNGDHEQSLTLIDRIRRDDKYFAQRGEAELMRARSLMLAGRGEQAHDLLRRLLYDRDPTMRIDRIQGQIHYRLGEVYRDALNNYPRAAAHFDTAATSLRQAAAAAREVRTTPEALLDGDRQAQSYGAYALVQSRLAEMDSLLYLGSLDDDAFAAAIEAIAEQRRQEALAAERERRRIEEQQGFGTAPTVPGTAGTGATGGEAAPLAGASGFLSYQNPVRVQENLIAFQTRWGDRPYVPNWRRSAAVTAAISDDEQIAEDRATASSGPVAAQIGEMFVDISAIPRTPEDQVAARRERAAARYELGNVLFLTLEDPVRAAQWYERVIEEDADFPVAARAYYALAETYLALGDEARAEQLFRQVAERFEDDPLAAAASERIGLEPRVTAPDEARQAQDRYAEAFSMWQERRHTRAFHEMIALANSFPDAEVAARARLAAGMIFTEWAAPDTLALLAPDPFALLDPADLEPEPAEDSPAPAGDEDGEPEAPAGDEGGEPVTTPDAPAPPDPVVVEQPDHDAAPVPLNDPLAPAGQPQPAEVEGAPAGVDADGAARVEPLDALDASAGGLPDPARPLAEPTPELPPTEPWLIGHYAAIMQDYPGSRYAERAGALQAAIIEQQAAWEAARPEPEEAPTADEPAGLPDPAGELALIPPPDDPADPTILPGEPRSDEAQLPVPADEEVATPDFDHTTLRSDQPLAAGEGGFSWVAFSSHRELEAQNRMIAFHNRGYRTALLIDLDDGGETFRVLLGQFESEAAASAARDFLPHGTDRDNAFVIAQRMAQKDRDVMNPRRGEQRSGPEPRTTPPPERAVDLHPPHSWACSSRKPTCGVVRPATRSGTANSSTTSKAGTSRRSRSSTTATSRASTPRPPSARGRGEVSEPQGGSSPRTRDGQRAASSHVKPEDHDLTDFLRTTTPSSARTPASPSPPRPARTGSGGCSSGSSRSASSSSSGSSSSAGWAGPASRCSTSGRTRRRSSTRWTSRSLTFKDVAGLDEPRRRSRRSSSS